MKLDDYITHYPAKARDMPEAIGVSREAVRKWRRGMRIPRRDTLAALVEFTGGLVTSSDFLEYNSTNLSTPPTRGAEEAKAGARGRRKVKE